MKVSVDAPPFTPVNVTLTSHSELTSFRELLEAATKGFVPGPHATSLARNLLGLLREL